MLVPEFENVVHKLEQQVTLRGQSKSTLQNYIRRIALFVVHCGKLPEKNIPGKKPGIDALIKQQQPPETNVERFERLTGFNPCLCPVCKTCPDSSGTGRMVVVRELPRIWSPEGGHLYKPVPFP